MPAKKFKQEVTEQLLLQAPSGLLCISNDGVIIKANGYCCRLLEYEKGGLEGLNINDLLSLPGKIFYQTHFYPLMKLQHHAEEIFMNLQTKTKKDTPVLLNAEAIENEDGFNIICSFIPVFNRKKYEDEILSAKKVAEEALLKNEELENIKRTLEEQYKALDKQVSLLTFQNQELLQLNDIVSHDLQEPVRKLILYSNELQRENIDEKTKSTAILVIQKSSKRIKNLLDSLQIYMNLTTNNSLDEQVDLDIIVQQAFQLVHLSKPHVKVHFTCEPLATISGSLKQLEFMFHHLFQNAFDHGAKQNQLILDIQSVILKENIFNASAEKYKYVDFIKITLTDQGDGFEQTYNDYIFNVTKRLNLNEGSSGFGLAYCKRIAENHRGSIKVEGMPGEGARFTILLPKENNL